MNNKRIERRHFLKNAGSLVAGTVFFHLHRMLGPISHPDKDRSTAFKEARHYTSGDTLAG